MTAEPGTVQEWAGSASSAQIADACNRVGSAEYQSFWEFFSEVFVPLNNLNIPLKDAHREVCNTLEDAVLGALGKQYVIINIPPRIGKTKIAEALICWHMAFFPQAQYLFTSYSADNAEVSLAYVRQTIRSEWFIEIFGDITGDIAKADRLTIKGGGNVYAAGLGGSLLGKGGGLKEPGGGAILVDDPSKANEALRESGETNVVNALELTLKNRRNSDQWCPIIIIAQRLAQNDLCGYVMDTYPDDYHLIKIPALNSKGLSNFPETYSTKNLIAARDHASSIIRFDFWSKMQQEPIALGGNLIPIDKFLRWDPAEAYHPLYNPGGMVFDRRVFTVDTALKTKEHNDFSCVQLWGSIACKAYLVDQIHGKWESPELLVNCKAFYEKWMTRDPRGKVPLPPTRLMIESKAAGTGLAQQMRALGLPAEEIERHVDKVTRVKSVLPHIETGLVVVPKDVSTPWIQKFLNECAAFSADGTAKHDDQCLVAGTLITTARGQIPIESVRVGDLAMTRCGMYRVTAAGQTRTTRTLWELTTAGGARILGTEHHPVWVTGRNEGKWIPLCDVREGAGVVVCDTRSAPAAEYYENWHGGRGGNDKVHSVFRIDILDTEDPVPVYNLAVESAHEYYANGVLVHNCDAMCDALSELCGQGLSIFDVLLPRGANGVGKRAA